MNMRKAVAAAFGASLLAAGTGAVAYGQLDGNKTGTATSSQKANAGTNKASAHGDATVDATISASGVVGAHQGIGRIKQNAHHTAKTGNSSASTHGSAKSGSQTFRVR